MSTNISKLPARQLKAVEILVGLRGRLQGPIDEIDESWGSPPSEVAFRSFTGFVEVFQYPFDRESPQVRHQKWAANSDAP